MPPPLRLLIVGIVVVATCLGDARLRQMRNGGISCCAIVDPVANSKNIIVGNFSINHKHDCSIQEQCFGRIGIENLLWVSIRHIEIYSKRFPLWWEKSIYVASRNDLFRVVEHSNIILPDNFHHKLRLDPLRWGFPSVRVVAQLSNWLTIPQRSLCLTCRSEPRSLILAHLSLNSFYAILGSPDLFLCCSRRSGELLNSLLHRFGNRIGLLGLFFRGLSQSVSILPSCVHLPPLGAYENGGNTGNDDGSFSPAQRRPLKTAHLLLNLLELLCRCWLCCWGIDRWGNLDRRATLGIIAVLSGAALIVHAGLRLLYRDIIVTQKLLTTCDYCITNNDMANVLNTDKQIAIIGALTEGSSIRSIERITGVHRDTIMRLGVRVGKKCELLLDSKMQDLGCNYLQFDELWGFIGKKERHVKIDDDPEMGDVWTYCAIDPETKLVPAFRCGKRNHETTTTFVQDVASRMRNRVQISTDALRGYVEAIEQSFGADVDYGQIVKVYLHDDSQHPERKYSAPHFAKAMRRPVAGDPEMDMISTSHVERLNATTRLHVKRLSRLTLAFSKKLENFKAAVALHFAYYNFVRRHATLRCTPAMAAGVERDFWSVEDLVEDTR